MFSLGNLPMTDRRSEQPQSTPLIEDWGYFKNAVVTVKLTLTPLKRENTRGDLVFIGYQGKTRIEVLFAGRRRNTARFLEARMDLFLKDANSEALSNGKPLPHPATLRFPITVEGAWRTRIEEVADDEVERIYQFIAGRWTFRDQAGIEQEFGAKPVSKPVTRMPVS